MSWNNNVVLEFLDLYRREQNLWDPKHPLHRNRTEIADAWLRIQTSLSINCSIIDLKKKKESLMTSFRMHWNRKKKNPETYHTSWFAYPLMESFLGGKYECDSTNQMDHEYFGSTSAYTTQPTMPEHHNAMQNLNTVERFTIEKSNAIKPACVSKESLNRKSEQNLDINYTKNQIDEVVTYLKKSAGEKRDKDEYDLYGQLLAKKLRKLDEHQRDIAMHEIDNIMFRAKMQSGPSNQISHSHESSSSPPITRKLKSPLFIVTQQSHGQYEDENL